MLRYFQYTGLLFNDVETCSVVHRLPDKAIRMILGCKIDPSNSELVGGTWTDFTTTGNTVTVDLEGIHYIYYSI